MNQIIVTDPLMQQLRGMAEPCVLTDPAGNRLGWFTPGDYEGYECPLSDAELDRIEQQGGGRPLAEILRDLESRA